MKSRVLTTIALCSATLTVMTTTVPAFAAGQTNNQPAMTQVQKDGAQATVRSNIQSFSAKLVGASDVVTGHTYSLNVHTRQLGVKVDKIEYDVTYDTTQFEYIGADQLLGGDKTTVTKVKDGIVHVSSTADLSGKDFREYNKTRLARVKLKAKAVGNKNSTATIAIKSAKASVNGQAATDMNMDYGGQQNVTIHAKDINDYNGDGIVGVGDVALAPKERQAEVAKAAEIRPYKHVIVLTTDGGGNPWSPEGMYYAKDKATLPKWVAKSTGNAEQDKANAEILAKRKNTYTMDLFNKQFAMSTTAQAVQPTISAQNYSSMLHGLAWGDMDSSYQMTNGTAGQFYFNDFGKQTPKYPSVFKVLQQANPHQGAAAFAEWTQILNGITEADAPVATQPSKSLKSFDDVADYVGTDQFKDTSLVYMQSDYMDGQGHSQGWYDDNYWDKYEQYDGLFKKVMDKLEATGHAHDTLVIANADHGGSMKSHGSAQYTNDDSNKNIFIALGGETIDSGHRLNGGSNSDISALVLNALRVKQPASMTGKVFDSSAFLNQTDLAKKNRNVESIKLNRGEDKVDLTLKGRESRQDSQIRTVDSRINLAGREVAQVVVPTGAKVIRQSVENGVLKLTTSYDKTPTGKLATVQFKAGKTNSGQDVTLKEAMLGTSTGNEILPDLTNNGTTTSGNGYTAPSTGGSSVTTTPGTGSTGSSTSTTKPTKPTKPTETTKPEETTKPSKHKANKLKGKVVYAQKKIGFYKSTKFTKHNRYKFFTAKTQNKWAQFKIVTKKGNRYQVKDINKGSKTYGKTGYITTSSKFVTGAEYTKKATKVKVIAPRGLSAYKSKNLTGKATHYKKNAVLKVKKIVKVKGKYHFQLQNGKYITADKHMIHAYFAK
ncbi:DUF5776 domain-containing protein [Lactiplantibacillus daowaiensis]|uniref:DUF5776 domain-containing protein n=1 Tax=Lactiplantibacillus daowaiensis TaxID=2559918 RepID=A0ABW1S1D5_9LACO|nr:DUF5776 domain-containing protein [Lactiplantibacillus daowaiensis]